MRRYRDRWNADAGHVERDTLLKAGLAGALQARSHGIGNWSSYAHGIGDQLQRAAAEKRDHVSAPYELVDGWRDVGDSADIISLRHAGWYSDADGSETYRGHVWQLPARDGSPRYVAGYTEDQGGKFGTRAGGYVMLECERGALAFYDDKEDAARAGDGLAERMAEDAREYSERWQEASGHASDRYDARKDLKNARHAARVVVKALRETKDATGLDATRALLRDELAQRRDAMREALQRIAECSEKIADLDMTGEF
jgi:hypothetical protein